ncbi:hypothetical protein V6Z11_D08G126300 [Gossypium hirsutum]|uniref:Uncharacterized protein isoform X4 n=2 Tax=Gossypium TaxID=3633 RepID=A0ABM3AJS2_GOSHI|nr:uncharacterized protein LOC107911857 isoform X4 [Gossypium hirsutum]TYH58184.1 hypothetical protein ES332_D08G136400v1 [Gossypium tomentosum]TYH58185.1 hypothetical protein ES332_D08G136400v1 [Gossypium tomentosum]TYH58187.1 hypothetical protein ES332_D08G136400v1 [Gossypium tomentosum]
MPEEARNRRCKLLLVSLLLVTSYCLKFMVTNLLQRKLFIFLRIEAKLFTVELSSPALVSLFPVLYLPSIPGGVVCKMLKQAIWKVLSERVVLDYGDKLLLPCLYLPTTSFHAGQMGVGEYDQRENIRYGDSQPSSGFLDT